MANEPLKALVVDDSPIWCRIYKKVAEQHDFIVDDATSLDEAENFLSKSHYALVITDVSLKKNIPNQDGLLICERIKNEGWKTKVIIITGTVDPKELEIEPYRDIIEFVFEKVSLDKDDLGQLLSILNERLGQTGAETAKPTVAEQAEKKIALIVENDPIWQKILNTDLKVEGYETVIVDNFAIALGEAKRKKIDLVTLDLELKSSEKDNRHGEDLVPIFAEAGIRIIIVSGKLSFQKVIEDYKRYPGIYIIDKISYRPEEFREIVRKPSAQAQHQESEAVSLDLIYKAVQTFLRNTSKTDKFFFNSPPIIEISKIIGEPVGLLVVRLRHEVFETFNELLEDAAKEEMEFRSLDEQTFPTPMDFIGALIRSLQGMAVPKTHEKLWPLKKERMKRLFVLDALYRNEYAFMQGALQEKLAVSKGALNHLREAGITELSSKIRSAWFHRD